MVRSFFEERAAPSKPANQVAEVEGSRRVIPRSAAARHEQRINRRNQMNSKEHESDWDEKENEERPSDYD